MSDRLAGRPNSTWPRWQLCLLQCRTSWQLDNKGSIQSTRCTPSSRRSTSIHCSNLRIVLFFGIADWKQKTFTTWCHKTNVTNGVSVDLRQARGSSRRCLLSLWIIAYMVTRWQHMKYWANSQSKVRVFGLKWPSKTRHLFTLSVIAGTDNQ